MMFRTRLIPLLTLENMVINSYLLILLSTLGTTFETVYGLSPGASGLAYLGMLVGFLASELTLGLFLDTYATRKARRHLKGTAKPEDHLPPIIFRSLLWPASLLLYGWTLEQRTMWLASVVELARRVRGHVFLYSGADLCRCLYPACGQCDERNVDYLECHCGFCASRSRPAV